MTQTIPFFVPLQRIGFSDSMKSVKIEFQDSENKDITRVVSCPVKSAGLRGVSMLRGILLVSLPYWFVKDKGLDTVTGKGQMKWKIKSN